MPTTRSSISAAIKVGSTAGQCRADAPTAPAVPCPPAATLPLHTLLPQATRAPLISACLRPTLDLTQRPSSPGGPTTAAACAWTARTRCAVFSGGRRRQAPGILPPCLPPVCLCVCSSFHASTCHPLAPARPLRPPSRPSAGRAPSAADRGPCGHRAGGVRGAQLSELCHSGHHARAVRVAGQGQERPVVRAALFLRCACARRPVARALPAARAASRELQTAGMQGQPAVGGCSTAALQRRRATRRPTRCRHLVNAAVSNTSSLTATFPRCEAGNEECGFALPDESPNAPFLIVSPPAPHAAHAARAAPALAPPAAPRPRASAQGVAQPRGPLPGE